MLIELALGSIASFILYKIFRKNPLSELPGPKSWPIIGNGLQVEFSKPPIQLAQWSKIYGPIYKINMYGTVIVVCSGTNETHEVTLKTGNDFSNRMVNYSADLWNMGRQNGILAPPFSENFKMKKKLFLKGLKVHNIPHIEALTLDIALKLVEDFKNTNMEAFNPRESLYNRIYQFLYAVMFGKEVTMLDEEFEKLKQFDQKSNKIFGEGNILDAFPWLRFLGNKTYKEILEINEIVIDLFHTWKTNITNECWFNDILSLAKDNEDFTETDALRVIMDFFFAGAGTTSRAFLGFLAILIHNPDVQKRLQTEADKTLDGTNYVAFSKRDQMPFTFACILETLRYQTVAPVPGRVAGVDSSINGYKIPKDTIVLLNLWGKHHNPDYFPQPMTFMPERFLTDDGQLVPAGQGQRKHLLPFGAGTRVCPGEVLAMTRLFVLCTTVVKNCEVLPETTIEDQPSIHPHDFRNAILEPRPYKMRVQMRSKNI